MIHLIMTTEVSSVRAYDNPGGYENRSPYLAILTVTHLTDKTVYLHGAVGKIDREMCKEMFAMLQARGITTVMMERHGKMKTISIRNC